MYLRPSQWLIAALCLVRVHSFGGLEAIPFAAVDHHALTHSLTIASGSSFEAFTSSTNTLASSLLTAYTDTLATYPLPTKVATGASLAVVGDAIAQSREPDAYDKRRAASFMMFDMAYRATQHALFPIIVLQCHGQFLMAPIVALSPWWASFASLDALAAMERTLASQLGIVPFLYYPVFFALTGAVQGLSLDGAINRAKENFIPLMKRNLLFWIPVQFVQFGFVEENLQIPFLSVCGLCWTFVLSVMAGSTKNYNQEESTADSTVTTRNPVTVSTNGATSQSLPTEDRYCVTGFEEGCHLPDDLFPHTTLKDVSHELEHMADDFAHELVEIADEVAHEIHDLAELTEEGWHEITEFAHLERKSQASAKVDKSEMTDGGISNRESSMIDMETGFASTKETSVAKAVQEDKELTLNQYK